MIGAVDHGRVVWLAHLPRGVRVDPQGQGFQYATSGTVPAPVPVGISRCDAFGVAVQLRARPPSLDELLVAQARIRAGEAPSAALERLLTQPGDPR